MEYFGQTWSPSIGRPNPGITKLKKNIYQSFWKLSFVHSGIVGLSNPLITSGASTFSKLGGPISWSEILLPFSGKKFDRYSQFGVVCYPHQTPTKSYIKKLGGPSIFLGGGADPLLSTASSCAHANYLVEIPARPPNQNPAHAVGPSDPAPIAMRSRNRNAFFN